MCVNDVDVDVAGTICRTLLSPVSAETWKFAELVLGWFTSTALAGTGTWLRRHPLPSVMKSSDPRAATYGSALLAGSHDRPLVPFQINLVNSRYNCHLDNFTDKPATQFRGGAKCGWRAARCGHHR
jgi:hypothetical protein